MDNVLSEDNINCNYEKSLCSDGRIGLSFVFNLVSYIRYWSPGSVTSNKRSGSQSQGPDIWSFVVKVIEWFRWHLDHLKHCVFSCILLLCSLFTRVLLCFSVKHTSLEVSFYAFSRQFSNDMLKPGYTNISLSGQGSKFEFVDIGMSSREAVSCQGKM